MMKRRSQDHIDENGEVQYSDDSPRKRIKADTQQTNGELDKKDKHSDDRSNDEKEKEADKAALTNFVKNKRTIEALEKKGIKAFFPIQYETFDVIYKGKDLIARDRTGSGKTIAFSLPVIQRFRDQDEFSSDKTKLLVVLPTRQLAIQVRTEIVSLRHKSSEFSVVNVYGGADIHEQIRDIRQGADIIVATPGRLLDLLERGVIKLNHLKTVVLDEADEMLRLNFQQDIEKIFQYISKHSPKKTQNLLFSATIPSWVLDIAKRYLSPDREYIDLIKSTQMKTSKTVEHLAINCPYYTRNSVISDVVDLYGGRHGRTIIFCQTKKQANQIIAKANIKQQAQVLNGDIPQKQRQVTFKCFKEGKLKCLVATNVAARGLDIPEVDLIVQLQPPKDVQTYIHRAGRTGRAGRSGICVTFYTRAQISLIERIQRMAKIKFKKTGAPQPGDIVKASARDIVISLKSVSNSVLPYFTDIAKQMIDEVGPIEALAKALAYISGNTQKITQRSLLNSTQGFITYILKSPVYIFNFLRNYAPEKLVSEIKGMKKFGNTMAAFDVPDNLKEYMDKAIKQISQQSGRSKGFTLQAATTLADLQQLEEFGQQSRDRRRSPSPQMDERLKRQAFKRKRQLQIFVGGLPYNADQNEISDFFKSKKVVPVQVRVLRSQQGESRGVAFVLCADDRSVRNALSLNGEKFGSRIIKINIAANK